MSSTKTVVILKNLSKRGFNIDGVELVPTAAIEFNRSVLNYYGIQRAIENAELVEVDEVEAPILDTKEAEADAEKQKRLAAAAQKKQKRQAAAEAAANKNPKKDSE